MVHPVQSCLALLLLLASFPARQVARAQDQQDWNAFFESKIRPVLVRECYGCHSDQAGTARGGLRLDTRELTHIGGASGPAVVPGDLEASLLFNAISHEDLIMPPERKLSAAEIADFRRWIEAGAVDPRRTEVEAIRSTVTEQDIQQARQTFWAYQTPQQSPLPEAMDSSWVRTPIDRFILHGLRQQGLAVAADAAPHHVLRRLCFDLIGLPPTLDQQHDFLTVWEADPDRAISELADDLLNRSSFGERWGRHWLDVARFAESTGREINMTYPHAWRYRDYVIDAFNADKPFDQFVREQLAGDLLPAADDQQWAQQLVATTFLALGPKDVGQQNRRQFAADLIDEQIDATSRVFLGTSVACARCHDHKFEPISQSDYYALAGIFQSTVTFFGNPPPRQGDFRPIQVRQNSGLLRLPVEDPSPYDRRYSPAQLETEEQRMRDLREQLAEAQAARRSNPQEAGRTLFRVLNLTNRLGEIAARLAVVDPEGNPLSFCMGVQDSNSVQNAQILVRGEISQASDLVPRGLPRVFSETPLEIPSRSSGRLQLAQWLTEPGHPLTSRVMVNRIWQHLFGRGIVSSVDDFGVTGTPPSHPELLDHLAIEFVQGGWSVKSLIKQIVCSRTYRLSARSEPESLAADPENIWLSRAHRRRLDAEAIRDSLLAISDQLDQQRPRGSSVAAAGYIRVRDGLPGGSGRSEAERHRSVYLPAIRDSLPRSLAIFDMADPNIAQGTRETSNTADQALFMLNNPVVLQTSERLAEIVRTDAILPSRRVRVAFLRTLSRPPSDDESAAAIQLIKEFQSEISLRGSVDPWAILCQSLIATAEFRFLD